jgi:autotransporter-associated beta strand protein
VANNAATTVAINLTLPAPTNAQTYNLIKNSAGVSTGTQLGLDGVISGGNANTTLFLNTSVQGDNSTTFRFSGNNTFVGTIRLNRGAIVVTNVNSLGAASNPVILDGNSNSTLGDLRFETSMTFTHPIGSLTAGNGNPINTNGNNVIFSAAYSGPAALTKIGAGDLTLAAVNTHTGATIINAGRLLVNGSITNSALTINAGGTLGGSGTVAGVMVAGGILAPGNSPGLLSTGSVTTSNPSSSFAFEIGGLTPGTQHDRISTTGSIGLDGSLVVTLTNSFVPAEGNVFPIWLNDSTDLISGTFAGLAEGATFAAPETGGSWKISYVANGDGGSTGNDISLTYSAVPEGSVSLLASLAGLVLLGRRRR